MTPQINFTSKTVVLILFLFALPLFISAQSLAPDTEQPLYKHLFEINKQWQHYQDATTELQQAYSFNSDQQRIQKHLQVTTNILRSVNTQHLNDAQLLKRRHLLNALEQYWKTGEFPINNKHASRQAYFLDSKQTSCAVAHLMLQDGQTALVQKINAENNYAYIDELIKLYPSISSWALNNGFTIQELALIQPGYFPDPQTWYSVGNDAGIEGRINVMKTSHDGSLLFMAGQFTAIDNIAANNIIAWDGEDWSLLADGVYGEVLAMDTDENDNLYIVGDFGLSPNTPLVNIAMWDGTEWTALQSGQMNGSVNSILVANDDLIVGGDFQIIDGQSINYLAKKSLTQQSSWNNQTTVILAGSTYTVENAFAVNEAVSHLILMENGVLIGGEFTQTAPNVTNTLIQQLDTRYLAHWDNNNWATAYHGPYLDVQALGYANENIFVGSSEPSDSTMNTYLNNQWFSEGMERSDTTAQSKIFNGFVELNSRYYAYGNLLPPPFSMVAFRNVMNVSIWGGLPGSSFGTRFDGEVRASEVFQNHIYFAGNFTWAGDESNPFDGLVQSPFADSPNSTDEASFTNVNIYCNNKQLHINYDDLSNQTQLLVYNLQGQAIESYTLSTGAADLQKDLSRFSEGVYFYQLVDGDSRYSGKLAVF